MNRIIRLMIFSVLALLILAACGPPAESENTAPAAEVDSGAAASSSADEMPPLDAPSEDLALVSATGRPQFLNSYADW